tara:strand:- start:160 stop:2292 length:2133 start_codon:yes stop_codon:yes gene_type:complete
MAEFAGFTEEQVFKLAQMKGYTGDNNSNSVNNFIMGNNQARSYIMDMYSEATTLVGRQKRGFAPGGLATMNKYISGSGGNYKDLSSFDNYDFSNAPFTKEEWLAQAKSEGGGSNTQQATDMNIKFGATAEGATTFTPDDTNAESVGLGGNTATTTSTTSTDTEESGTPGGAYAPKITSTPISTITDADKTSGKIADGTGQITGTVDTSDKNVDIGDATTADYKGTLKATTIADTDVSKTADKIDENLKDVDPAKGTVSEGAKVKAVTGDKDDLNQLDLKAAQIDEATQVKDVGDRTIQDGELVQSAYDKDKADEVVAKTEASFATASPSVQATVKGQLDELMTDFEPGRTPPWAAGAMRTALAAMNARGLSASSMAGQAIVQAAMESAIPIATADAGTIAKFEMQNLNNKQQSIVLAAEQRANFLGIEFDQEFQARVKNATTISDIAKQNYDADVQIALENARMANTVDIANLEAKNAKVLSDAAALTKLDLTNLTNKQQAEVANAKAFLDMDIANLENEQQTTLFKAEAKVQAMFKDQVAENAQKQFNAEQKNQVDMFVDGLIARQEIANAEQKNAMSTVEFQEQNAMNKFFSTLKENRSQFNATNSLTIAQANAQWEQLVTTTNTAAKNAANMQDAQNATAFTKTQLDHIFQADRDMMNWIFTASDNDKQRAASLMIAQLQANSKTDAAKANGWSSIFQNLLGVLASV